jgi:hypothetical protein
MASAGLRGGHVVASEPGMRFTLPTLELGIRVYGQISIP